MILAAYERELARRVGPWDILPVSVVGVGAPGTASLVYSRDLQSSIESGDHEGKWLLRRGLTASDVLVPMVTVGDVDRVRRVKTDDRLTGALESDRLWSQVPTAGEVFELGALDPVRIRRAVQRGLERCYFRDRVSVTVATAAEERDLTALVPWITRVDQVLDVAYAPTGSTAAPTAVRQWEAFPAGGGIWLWIGPDPAPATLSVRVLRPHASWVNGADSTTGPTTDLDELAAPLDYAVCMAHDWLWDTAKDLLRPLVSEGLGTPEEDVRSARARYVEMLRTPDRVLLPTDPVGLRTY